MNVDTHRITRIADRGKTIPRAGTTITELLVACTIVGTLLTTTVPVLVRTGRLSRELSRHRLALDELSNQLDRLTLLPLDELKPSLNALTLDESVAAHLSRGRITRRARTGAAWPSVNAATLLAAGRHGNATRCPHGMDLS